MPFTPIITLSAVPRSSDSFTTTDATPTNNTDGYGATNAPANAAALTIVWSSVQPYGEDPIPSSAITGSVSTTVVSTVDIPDGVDTFHLYYGMQQAMNFTVASDRMSISTTDTNLLNYLDSVVALQIDTTYPILIKSISNGTVYLASPLPGALMSGTSFYKYYHAQVQALIMNVGEGGIINSVAKLPVLANPCNTSQKILDNILLKIGAQVAFDAGNLAKAHEAARLLANNKPYVQTSCVTCQ